MLWGGLWVMVWHIHRKGNDGIKSHKHFKYDDVVCYIPTLLWTQQSCHVDSD